MEPGEILRIRKIKAFGAGDHRNYFEFSPDNERVPARQDCFVVLLLGREARKLVERPGSTNVVNEPLDYERVCNGLGFWTEKQMIELLGEKRGASVVKALHNKRLAQIHKGRHVNQRLEGLKEGPTEGFDNRG